jgi:hypothetical protein
VSNLEQLLSDVKESLEREIHGLEVALAREMREGFAQISTRFDAQDAWLDREFAEVRERLTKLGRKSAS